jgi:hypothetical protein
MPEDLLDTVLRLVADGRLTPEEAGPILAALDAQPGAVPAGSPGSPRSSHKPGVGPASDGPFGADASGRSLRIEVREQGRIVVNLRLPLALGRYALDRIPGLSGDQVDRVRSALRSGMTGPVLVVDDDGDGVQIAID